MTESMLLAAVVRRLLRDQDKDPQYLIHREASVRATLPEGMAPTEALRSWARFFESETIDRYRQRERLFFAVCFALGLCLGILAASGVVWLEVPAPANVLLAFLILLVLPLLLLLLSLLFVMPAALWRHIPLLRTCAEWASPTLMIGMVSRLNSVNSGGENLAVAPLTLLPRPVRERFLRWSAVVATQTLALGFGLGSIISILFAVSVTDVAFVWSTTLAVDTETFYRITQLVATPWAQWLPEAVPSYSLVEQSRFYRMKTNYAQPELFGAWWTFLLACLLFYSVFPRMIVLMWARQRREAAARSALLQTPGVEALLRRLLNPSPLAEWSSTERQEAAVSSTDALPLPCFEDPAPFSAVVWAAQRDENLLARLRTRCSATLQHVYFLGGLSDTAEDEQLLSRIAKDPHPLILFVRGWEPPTAELIQSVKALAARSASAARFKVVLLALPGRDGENAVAPQQQRVWRNALPTTIPVERMCDD